MQEQAWRYQLIVVKELIVAQESSVLIVPKAEDSTLIPRLTSRSVASSVGRRQPTTHAARDIRVIATVPLSVNADIYGRRTTIAGNISAHSPYCACIMREMMGIWNYNRVELNCCATMRRNGILIRVTLQYSSRRLVGRFPMKRVVS